MKTKNLYVIIKNLGDGSCSAYYTFNEQWVLDLKTKLNSRECESWEFETYCDGDGFHYDVLTVPEECTLESLGIRFDLAGND